MEFPPGSTHYLLSVLESPSNLTECQRNLKLVVVVGAGAAEAPSVNKPRRQLQTRLAEAAVPPGDWLRAVPRQSYLPKTAGQPANHSDRLKAKLVSSASSLFSQQYCILLLLLLCAM